MTTDKNEMIAKLGAHENDTGSAAVQIGLLTRRISHLTAHLNKFKKDYSSRRSLLKLAGKRRRLLKYLNRTAPDTYLNVIKELKIRGV
jgi:small subunit ribosomal protein S15